METNGRADRQTDGRTDGGDCITPPHANAASKYKLLWTCKCTAEETMTDKDKDKLLGGNNDDDDDDHHHITGIIPMFVLLVLLSKHTKFRLDDKCRLIARWRPTIKPTSRS